MKALHIPESLIMENGTVEISHVQDVDAVFRTDT